jgi:anti-anti-sigma factor
MEIRKRFARDIVILYITGQIDINSAALIERTGQFLKDGIKKILLNFASVTMVDYNGLSILAITYKNAVNQKGVVKLCNVPRHIGQLLKTARLDMTFEIYPDEDTALKCFNVSTKVDTLTLRRRFKRIDVNIPVYYKTGLSANEKMNRGKILNMSGEGIYIYTKETLPASSQVYMEIRLGRGKKPLTLMGEVVWLADKEIQPHSYPGMGIKFATIERKAQEQIISFIDKNLTTRSKV